MKNKAPKEFSAKDFRAELVKIMPGYNWTVHKQSKYNLDYFEATGIQSSGSNRLSTLSVVRTSRDGKIAYEAKSAGYGTHAKWLHRCGGKTLASALRGLQEHYEWHAAHYRGHANALQNARLLEAKADG